MPFPCRRQVSRLLAYIHASPSQTACASCLPSHAQKVGSRSARAHSSTKFARRATSVATVMGEIITASRAAVVNGGKVRGDMEVINARKPSVLRFERTALRQREEETPRESPA